MKKQTILILLLYCCFLVSCEKSNESDSQNEFNNLKAGLVSDSLWNPPLTAIHIDAGKTGDLLADGSIEHPYSSFKAVKWKDEMIVALKRGTTINNGTVIVQANNVTIASYGFGVRPVIVNSTGKDHGISTYYKGVSGVTIRDIEVQAPDAVSCIIIQSNSPNAKIINCKLSGAQWGIRVLDNSNNLYIYNTEVFNIFDDGMFIKNIEKIEIANCYVHHVNQNWKAPSTSEELAGGDGIQLYLCNQWRVHHTLIDRSDNGNKFCFISNNSSQKEGILEYNYFKGPNDCSHIYLGDGTGHIIRYNYFAAPGASPIFSHSEKLNVYCNIFDNIQGPLFVNSAIVYNNLFYKFNAPVLEGKSVRAVNNIFDLKSITGTSFKVNNLSEDHNLFVQGIESPGSNLGKPMYIDEKKSDFRLQRGSSCIDQGVDMGLKNDFDGNLIPSGSAPDIGPYEYTEIR